MRMTKEERLLKSRTVAGLDELADAKERSAQQRGELTRLTQFMKRGGELVEEQLPGLGVVFRSLARTSAPFSAEAVQRYRERAEASALREDRKKARALRA